MQTLKESFVAYARTLVVIWQSGSLAVLGMFLLTLLPGVVPACQFFVTERLVNTIVEVVGDANWWQAVLPWLIGLLGLRILSTGADLLREPLYTHLGENIEIWINDGIAQKVDTTALIEIQTAEFQDSLERARAVSGLVLQNILWYLVDSLQQLISVVTLGIVLWQYHPLLALLPALTGMASWWSDTRFSADLYGFDVEQTPQRREQDALEGILTDRGTGKEVRLYQTQNAWIEHWHQLGQSLIDGQMGIRRRKFSVCLALDTTRGLLYAGSLILLLLEVFRGELTVGTYIAAAAGLVQLDGIWDAVAFQFQAIVEEMRPLFGDLYRFLNRQSDTQFPDTADEKINEFDGNRTVEDIAVADLSFFYPNSQKPSLTDITLTFKKGERVAIVGPNGAGKTTLARVLLGLYRPHSGSIRVGDIPLTEENRRAWLTHCSAVFQDFTQYHLTARENITFGDLEHPERMEMASIAGGAASVVEGLTEGYETLLGPTFGGRDLSGGEWQRLATARSFMRKTPWLVVLDEPTAALDPLAEQAVYERFIERSAGRTSVLISHRLSSVRTCDRILVLDNGRIVEDGDHETLLAQDGLYAQFFRAQAQWYV
ncbi:ABC transporter ATP-binding protein [Candidatus Poribacteria bacterium]|nr:ABC transporter ATP-binding protein [Candidatus Poribacteria bacterium]MYA57556.1 ABC transporter ATP-binding protein [Candidatus Poribacteria bacterium]